MKRIFISKTTAFAAVCLMAVCSCVNEMVPTGGFGRGYIEPTVSFAGEMTKSSGTSPEGRYMGSYAMEGVGSDSLYISVYEYDNTDLPYGMTEEEEPQTKGKVVTTDSINVTGTQFTINAWLESVNRYDGTQNDDGRVYITSDKDNWRFMNNVIVERDASGWIYANGLEYPWRNQVKTNFWSYYYKGNTIGHQIFYPGSTATDEEQKHLTIHYAMALPAPVAGSTFDDAVRQGDLCIAYNTKTWEDGDDNKINIEFHHALSAVYFSVADVFDGVTVKQIGLDDILSTGWCDVTGNSNNTPSFVWRDLYVRRNYLQDYDSTSDFSDSGRTQPFYDNEKIFTVLPQELGDSTCLRAKFQLSDGSLVTRTVNISKFSDGTSVEWKPGKKYLYKIGFNGYEYTFDLMTASDSLVSFSNTTTSSTFPVGIKSFKTAANGTKTEVDWKIKSVRIGSGATETIAAGSFTDKDGLSAQAQLSSKRLSLTSSARISSGKGSNDWWTNREGVSGDTDGSLWSPKSWGSDGLNKGVIDLSKYNPYTDTPDAHEMTTANCYIIRHAGTYKLPLVYGNAICNGYVDNQSFAPTMAAGGSASRFLSPFVSHLGTPISGPYIESNGNAASCSIVWQDEAEVVKNLQIVPGSACSWIQFEISQEDICQNNAVIAVRDGNGDIMWSWHIWTTNDPALISGAVPVNNHAGNVYNFFPFNVLGWIEPVNYPARDDVRIVMEQEESGNEIEIVVKQPDVFGVSSGCFYQFGRKDPMSRKNTPFAGNFNKNGSGPVSLATAVLHPDTYYAKDSVPNDWSSSTYDNLWTGRLSQYALVDEGADLIKTIYDPSPVGYKMPASNAFTGFTTTGGQASSSSEFNVIGEFDNGWKFKTGYGDATIFFPAAGYRSGSSGNMARVGEYGNFWSAVNRSANDGYCLKFESNEFLDPVHPYYWRSHAFAVRPVTYEPVLNALDTDPGFNDYDDKGDKDLTF